MKKITFVGLVSAFFLIVVSPAKAEDVTDLELVASVLASEETVGAMMDDMVLQAESLLDPVLSTLGPAAKASKELIRDAFRARVNAQLAELAYANQLESLPQTFSDQEIADIAAFLRTPSGRAWAQKQPALLKANSQIAVGNSSEAAMSVAKNLIEDIRENGGPKNFVENLKAEKN